MGFNLGFKGLMPSSSYTYRGITFTNSPSLCIVSFSANLANLAVLLPQSHDSSC